MNAEDENRLMNDYWVNPDPVHLAREAYALGRRAGMTEAAGICNKNECATGYGYAAAIEKARDA